MINDISINIYKKILTQDIQYIPAGAKIRAELITWLKL